MLSTILFFRENDNGEEHANSKEKRNNKGRFDGSNVFAIRGVSFEVSNTRDDGDGTEQKNS